MGGRRKKRGSKIGGKGDGGVWGRGRGRGGETTLVSMTNSRSNQ
jgi:hypothetical protein